MSCLGFVREGVVYDAHVDEYYSPLNGLVFMRCGVLLVDEVDYQCLVDGGDWLFKE